tara:strand:+ start:19 stop:1155 length:1137 start_codon:yes stop_codon:yes gene_type:complete
MESVMKKLLIILLCLPFISLAQQTYIPDDNFEQALINLGYDNVLDNYVLTSNISNIGYLDVSSQNISDITGIQDFDSLWYLNCHDNQLITLDVSNNILLTGLHCAMNLLSSIDVSQNLYLEWFPCHDNLLTALDVTNNLNLHTLACYNNQLTDIDLSNNPNLISLGINNNLLYSLDLSFQDIQYVDCNNNQITNLTITSDSLKELDCGNNPFFLFDATNHPNLEDLEIYNTGIFEIDLSQNLDLWFLSIGSNPSLWSLDLSNNYNLQQLDVWDNSLLILDMRNGNNQNISYFVSWNSQYLECISVDDSIYSTNNWTSIETWQYFSNNCEGTTSIEEHTTNKELLKVTDILGREVNEKRNTPLFYIYNDGTVEKKIIIE